MAESWCERGNERVRKLSSYRCNNLDDIRQLLYIAELKRSRAALVCAAFFYFLSAHTRFMAKKYSWRKLLSKNKNTPEPGVDHSWGSAGKFALSALPLSGCSDSSHYFSFVRKWFLSRSDTLLLTVLYSDRIFEIVFV